MSKLHCSVGRFSICQVKLRALIPPLAKTSHVVWRWRAFVEGPVRSFSAFTSSFLYSKLPHFPGASPYPILETALFF